MMTSTRTREAMRAAQKILGNWSAASWYLADAPSLARIIDSETCRPELYQLHRKLELLRAAFADLLAYAESLTTRLDDDGNPIVDPHIEKALAALDAVTVARR